jgi:hypothetical protein
MTLSALSICSASVIGAAMLVWITTSRGPPIASSRTFGGSLS